MALVSPETTRRTTVRSFFSSTLPSLSVISATIYGLISSPPLIAAVNAVASCMPVHEMLWPKPMRARSASRTYFLCVTVPLVSPMMPLPVTSLKPNS